MPSRAQEQPFTCQTVVASKNLATTRHNTRSKGKSVSSHSITFIGNHCTDKMASIRRNDTLHRRHGWHRCCNYKSRPSKLEADGSKLNARKFKIVKRIFLASSFDRWRKLRSSLKLTDSSLAWHLMEAHENGECITCRLVKLNAFRLDLILYVDKNLYLGYNLELVLLHSFSENSCSLESRSRST